MSIEVLTSEFVDPRCEMSFWANGEEAYRTVTIADRLPTLRQIATGIADIAGSGGVVVLALENGPELAELIVSCLLARQPFVVISPTDPIHSRWPDYMKVFGEDWRASVLVSHDGQLGLGPFPGVQLSAEAALALDAADVPIMPFVTENDIIYFQMTSGTSGTKKAVPISPQMLRTNMLDLKNRCDFTRASRFVIWIPMSHDMGLANFLVSAHVGSSILILATESFVRNPLSWLRHVSRFAATITSVPSFALKVTARLGKSRNQGIDLSALRRIVVGAEPIFHSVLEDFQRVFSPSGLDEHAVRPAYGMAEAVVAISMASSEEPLRVIHITATDCSVGAKIVPTDDFWASEISYVSSGRLLDSISAQIWDDDGIGLPELTVGRIMLAGPNIADRYAGHPSDLYDGWRDTGDLGFLSEGEIFIIGRRKDIIIRGGRNFSCDEIEDFVHSLPDLNCRRVAALSVLDFNAQRERLLILCESREFGRLQEQRIAAELTKRMNLAPDFVLAVPPGSIPMTTSGKIKHQQLREDYAGYAATVRAAGELFDADRPISATER